MHVIAGCGEGGGYGRDTMWLCVRGARRWNEDTKAPQLGIWCFRGGGGGGGETDPFDPQDSRGC